MKLDVHRQPHGGVPGFRWSCASCGASGWHHELTAAHPVHDIPSTHPAQEAPR